MSQLNVTKRPQAVCFSKNPMVFGFKIMPYGVNETVSNARLAVEYQFSQRDRGVIASQSLVLQPDATGYCELDLQHVADDLLEFQFPEVHNYPQLMERQGAMLGVKGRLLNDYEQLEATPMLYHFVAKGGVQYDTGNYISSVVMDGKHGLLEVEHNDELMAGQPLWVTLLCDKDWIDAEATSVELSYTLSWTKADGSTGSDEDNIQNTSPFFGYGILSIPFSGILDILLPADAVAFTISISAYYMAAWQEVFAKSWRINHRHYYDTHTLLFHNSLGGLCSFVLRGATSYEQEIEKKKIKVLNYRRYKADGIVANKEQYYLPKERLNYKSETGWITLRQLTHLRQLFLNEVVYRWGGNYLKPFLVDDSKVALYKSNDDLYNLSLNWSDAEESASVPELPNAACVPPQFLKVTVTGSQTISVYSELPEGKHHAVVSYSPTNNLATATNIKVDGSIVDIKLLLPTSAYTYSGNPEVTTVYVWVRVRCNPDPFAPLSDAIASGAITVPKYAAPFVLNAYATTFKGSGARTLTFQNGSSIFKTLTTNNSPTLPIMELYFASYATSATGSAGGTFQIVIGTTLDDYHIDYTPPSATFKGLDIITIYTNYTDGFGTPTLTPQTESKIYVTVKDNTVSTGLNSLPYVRLEFDDRDKVRMGDSDLYLKKMVVRWYEDPFGITPLDVTGMNLAPVTVMLNTSAFNADNMPFGYWYGSGPMASATINNFISNNVAFLNFTFASNLPGDSWYVNLGRKYADMRPLNTGESDIDFGIGYVIAPSSKFVVI